jgi:hypothetical protein
LHGDETQIRTTFGDIALPARKILSWLFTGFLIAFQIMTSRIAQELECLDRLAFRRGEACGGLVRRFHSLPALVRKHPDYAMLEKAYLWLFVPYSLWPIDICGVVARLMDEMSSGRRPTEQMRLLVEMVGPIPKQRGQDAVATHEHDVQVGNYEKLISAQHKFDLKEDILSQRKDFKADWESMKATFPVDRFRDKKGIIRRRMAQERNFRTPDFKFRWRTKEERFRNAFDAFSNKWVLYGMEGERPLLLKLSVNVTALGTMIFIPRYWSFDRKRDLEWPAIIKLHRSRDVHRQGAKLTKNQIDRHRESNKALRFWKQATAAGLKGDRRNSWVMGKLGWDPRTDARQLRRLLHDSGLHTKSDGTLFTPSTPPKPDKS